MPYTEQRPSGRWRGVFRHPSTGRKVSKTFEFEYEAEGWAYDAEKRAADGAAPELEPEPTPVAAPVLVPSVTVAEHAAELLDRRAGRLADATRRNYATHRAGLIRSGIGESYLATLRRSDVERWVTAQVRDGVGTSTINARLKLLRMITADAKAELIIEHDPGTGVDYLTADIRADRVVTPAEESRLLLAAKAPLDTAALVALDAGLRWSEVYGLTVDSIAAEYITVRQVNERTTRKIRRYPKGHRARVVPMTERLMAALDPIVKAARATGGADGLLFTSTTGGVVNYESWRRLRWTPAVVAAELPGLGFHALRHTYGSRLAAASVPRSEIALVMGHADESTTARYIHAGDDGRRLDLIRAALGEKPGRQRSTG